MGAAVSVAIQRRAVTLSVNGAEYMELQMRAAEAGSTIPAYVRTRCGLPPWISRGAETVGRAPIAPPKIMALTRMTVGVAFTPQEFADVKSQASASGLSLPQYVRTMCDLAVRDTSLPNTEDRDREEDDAWDRLRRMGLNPQDYFED